LETNFNSFTSEKIHQKQHQDTTTPRKSQLG